MKNRQLMIEQINGIIHYFSDEGKKKLPENFIDFFRRNAQKSPEQVINPNMPLEEQNLCDDTLLVLTFINKLLSSK